MTSTRAWVAAVCCAVVLSACTSGGEKDEDQPSLPLPDKPPAAAGPATGPALEAKALFASADELEEQVGSVDSAAVDRRSGAFISGTTAVGYSVDDISAYDLETGDQRWTATLDMKGGSVCLVSQPDRAVKTFTVVYGDNGYCPSVATIRVSDGKVLSNMEEQDLGVTFEGESAGGSFEDLLTIKGKDYLIDMRGVVWRATKTDPEPMARLESDRYFNLYPSADRTLLVGSRSSDPKCSVDAYELPSFEHAWTTEGADAFPDQGSDGDRCVVSLSQGDPTWLMQQINPKYHMAKLDPGTGKVVGTSSAPVDSGGQQVEEGTFDLASAANQFDRAIGVGDDGDMIFTQARGLSRYSLETKKMAWELDLTQFEQESEQEFPLRTVLPQGVTDDGYLVATVSNDTTVEVVAVDVEKGTLVGRWPLPKEYRNGFQVRPGAALYDGGLVLTRNFEDWDRTFTSYGGPPEPEGDLFDIGVFTFPEPGEEVPPEKRPVPTAGPVDLEATKLAAVEAKEPQGEAPSGAVYTGSTIITYVDGALQAYTKSGKKAWSGTLAGEAGAEVCSTSEPDRRATSILMSYRVGKGKCVNLVRVGAKKGKQVEVDVEGVREVGRILTLEGTDYVITDGTNVNTVDGSTLTKVGSLDEAVYDWNSTPEDPTLMIGAVREAKGGDWKIEAYRTPTFEKVWSVKASKVFGRKPDAENSVNPFRGNGLWVSTIFGAYTPDGPPQKDAIVKLDARTGKVVGKTGVTERKYAEPDLTKLDVSSAGTSGYVSVGFDDGTVVVSQPSGIVRWSLEDEKAVWGVDTSSIETSMEKPRRGTYVRQDLRLVDGAKTIVVTLSNEVSTELMTLDAASGKITGRWKLATKDRNGLQVSPDVTAWAGGVALVRDGYSWTQTYGPDAPNELPEGTVHEIGLFSLKPQGKGD